jgi:hypothetical protein
MSHSRIQTHNSNTKHDALRLWPLNSIFSILATMALLRRLGNNNNNSPRSSTPSSFTINIAWKTPLVCFVVGYLLGSYDDAPHFLLINQQRQQSLSLIHTEPSAALQQRHASNNTPHHHWRTLSIYQGSSLGVEEQQLNTWFSQGRQDELVAALFRFKREGTFLDVAANDAKSLSNTYALEQTFGWTGFCMEPNAVYWRNLTLQRTCQVIAAVVGLPKQQVLFRFAAGDHGAKWHRESTLVTTVPLNEVLEYVRAPAVIDYLSLDVEGAESDILIHTLSLDKYYVKVITAERLKGPVRAYLKEHGFVFVQRLSNWGESLWIHKSAMEELDMSVIDKFGFPIAVPIEVERAMTNKEVKRV